MQKLLLSLILLCFYLSSSAQIEGQEYLQKVAINLNTLQSVSYQWTIVSSAPGDTTKFSKPRTQFIRAFANPSDTIVGVSTAIYASEAFNETVEELTQSLMPLVAENGMDWMYANTSTTAQRGALDWRHRFRDVTTPLFEELYDSVATGKEASVVIEANSKPDYREKLEQELAEWRNSELWQKGLQVRKLRPETSAS